MDSNNSFLIFCGIVVLGIVAGFEYEMTKGFAVIAIGVIILGLFNGMLNYLDGKRN